MNRAIRGRHAARVVRKESRGREVLLISLMKTRYVLLLLCSVLLAGCDRNSASRGDASSHLSPGAPSLTRTHSNTAEKQDQARSVSTASGAPDRTRHETRSLEQQPGTKPATAQPSAHPDEGSSPGKTGEYPPHGSALLPTEAHNLLSGTINFMPRPIPSSNTPVEPDTPLDPGQDLQVAWGGQWWAGTGIGIEQEGKVRIHYFGWADSWDEAKPRSELQLDRNARVRAIDSVYARKDW